jgi:hypothetical protein
MVVTGVWITFGDLEGEPGDWEEGEGFLGGL